MTFPDFVLACQEKDEAAMQAALIDLNVRQVDEEGRTALICACAAQSHSIVLELIARGSDARRLDRDRWGPLMYVASWGQIDVVRALLEAGADVHQLDRRSVSPLMRAARYGHDEMVSALLAAGSRVNQRDRDDCNALMTAARWGSDRVVRLLLEAGADPQQTDRDQCSALMLAAAGGRKDTVRTLMALTNPSDLGRMDKFWRTALDWAIIGQHWDCADLLVSQDPEFDLLTWPAAATLAELPLWHARLEQQAIREVLPDASRRTRPRQKRL